MTTMNSIATAMFSVTDQQAAAAWYTEKLGWELRTDVTFGEGDDAGRWVEVAPPGSTAVIALNTAWGETTAGGTAVGVEASDVRAERSRLIDAGVEVGDFMGGEGPVPLMFSVTDPDGNSLWIVQPPSA